MFLAARHSSPVLQRLAWFVAFLYVGLALAAVLHQHHGANAAADAACSHYAGTGATGDTVTAAEVFAADGCALCQIAAQTATPGAFAPLPVRPVEHALAAPPLPFEPQLLPLAALSRYSSRAPPVA